MARGDKTKAIRDYLAEHPGARGTEVVQVLRGRGVDVTRQQVSQVRKHKPRVNKSAAVRAYLAEHPGARPFEIVAALAEKHIKVTPQQVSTIKSKTSNGQVNVADLVTAKRFADRVGGVGNARELVEALGKLG